MKKVLKIAKRILLSILAFVGLYFLAAFTLPYICVNKKPEGIANASMEIYIMSNGVHTDLVLPIKTEMKNWAKSISLTNTNSKDTVMNFVAFGWGDKGFYLETPTWADLKLSTAVKAMFFMSTSAMHVTFYNRLIEGAKCKKIAVSKEQYSQLVEYIESSFKRGNDLQFEYIPNHAYGQNDGFYEANGVYNLFFTCNTWANQGLKAAGLRACLWTPFEKGIFYHYQ